MDIRHPPKMNLIISMGIPAKDFEKKEEGFRFDGAVIQIIDWPQKKIIKEIVYTPPSEHLENGLSVQFKGAAIFENQYFVVTNTELIIYNMSNWTIEKVISHPSFNDLHGVLPLRDKIYICNTGLELIQELDYSGNIVNEINIASTATSDRFDRIKDYRTIATTKPHEIHVNHLFILNEDLWATQGNLRSAVNIENRTAKLVFSDLFMPEETILCHDGIIKGDHIFFTTVNAHIVIFDKNTKRLVKDIDVNQLNSSDRAIGWTRGLHVVGNSAFLGITAMRHSKFKNYIKWFLRKGRQTMPSSIIEIDLESEKIIDSYEMEKYQGHAIYSILKGDP